MKMALYVRVSRDDLKPENQLMELEQYCKAMNWEYDIYEEKESTRKTRPIKKQVFDLACNRKYDGILVYKLDRWARSLQELLNDMAILSQNKVRFQILKDNIILDNDPRNMLMVHIIGAFAEFERAIIRERTMLGLAYARSQGRVGGRPRKNPSPKNEQIIKENLDDAKSSV